MRAMRLSPSQPTTIRIETTKLKAMASLTPMEIRFILFFALSLALRGIGECRKLQKEVTLSGCSVLAKSIFLCLYRGSIGALGGVHEGLIANPSGTSVGMGAFALCHFGTPLTSE